MPETPNRRRVVSEGVYVVAPVSARDLPGVIRVADEALTERYADGFFLAMRETAPETFLAAHPVSGPGEVAGFVLGVRSTPVEARLLVLAVRPAHQGHGLGARLLTGLERLLLRGGSLDVTLEVREDNVSAMRFYRRHGYDFVREIPQYYADGARAVVMRKAL